VILLAPAPRAAVSAQNRRPPQSHLIAVDNNVHLQYLDFGGNGPALVFLPGLGSTAYVYYEFAQRFTDRFHVYALTRRGYGASDITRDGYDLATRVEDLHGFFQAQGIKQAVLAGHSIAGNELTAFAVKYPSQALALVYLDAAYDRADTKAPQTNVALMAKVRSAWYGGNDSGSLASMDARRDSFRRMYFGIWSDAQEKNMREITVVNADGTVSDRAPAWVGSTMLESDKKERFRLQEVRAPSLLLFARQRLENRPIKLDAATRRELVQEEDRYEKYVNSSVEGLRHQRTL
jgi:pimeloyl-ACP methyl ester carboxylesterase